MYSDGTGVEQDYGQALQWYLKAAEQNEAEAQYNLGVLYQEGLGVEQNNKEAAYWYHIAADQGSDRAKERLRELGNSRLESSSES